MLRFTLFLVFVTLLSTLLAWFSDHPGEVSIFWFDYQVDSSLFAITLPLLLVTALLVGLFRVLMGLLYLPRGLRRRHSRHVTDRALVTLTRGYASLAIGDGKRAAQAGEEAARLLGAGNARYQPLAKLLQAQAAYQTGNVENARAHYEALLENADTEFAAIRGLLLTEEEEGRLQQAIELAERAYAKRPYGHGIASSLLRLYQKAERWENAEHFLQKYRKNTGSMHPFRKAEFDVDYELSQARLAQARTLLEDGASGTLLEKAFRLAESAHKLNPHAEGPVLRMAELARSTGKEITVRKAILDIWKKSPSEALGEQYLNLLTDLPGPAMMRKARMLTRRNPQAPASGYVLAQAAARAGDVLPEVSPEMAEAASIQEAQP